MDMVFKNFMSEMMFATSGWIYDPEAPLYPFASRGAPAGAVSHLKGDFEKPNGEWNILELYCYGDKAVHVVNGHVVLVTEHLHTLATDSTAASALNNGHIQLQSEGAEAFYRNIQIKKLDKMPDFK
jgi:3-keto-disaccharide hydrolase